MRTSLSSPDILCHFTIGYMSSSIQTPMTRNRAVYIDETRRVYVSSLSSPVILHEGCTHILSLVHRYRLLKLMYTESARFLVIGVRIDDLISAHA